VFNSAVGTAATPRFPHPRNACRRPSMKVYVGSNWDARSDKGDLPRGLLRHLATKWQYR
jgi:hypothetical protein